MIRHDTRLVIIVVSIAVVLVLMAINFGPTYAAIGVLAMIARLLMRPDDILQFVPIRRNGGACYSTGQFADLVDRFSSMSNIPSPRLLHTSGSRATAMVMGKVSDSVIILRGAVHALPWVEREALIAHEIGHLARSHFVVKWATSMVLIFALISVARWTIMQKMEAMVGDPFVSPTTGMVLLFVLSGSIIVHSWVSCLIEAEADDHAVWLTGRSDGVAAILRRHLPPAGTWLFNRITYWPIIYRLKRMEQVSAAAA